MRLEVCRTPDYRYSQHCRHTAAQSSDFFTSWKTWRPEAEDEVGLARSRNPPYGVDDGQILAFHYGPL